MHDLLKYKKYGPQGESGKKYNFQYMEDNIKLWKSEHITRDMLELIPWDIFIFSYLTESGYQKDHYGEDIIDFQDWNRQREEFLDYLFEKYKR